MAETTIKSLISDAGLSLTAFLADLTLPAHH
jgi:hypothetical protein